jgi:hypothetical protein
MKRNPLFTSNIQLQTMTDDDFEETINKWNHQAQPTDTIYVVGGFNLDSDPGEFIKVLHRLNGQIRLVFGPQDLRTQLSGIVKRLTNPEKLKILGPYYTLAGHHAGTKDKVIMHFWPLVRWDMQRFGSWHLHSGKPVETDLHSAASKRLSVDWSENRGQFFSANYKGIIVPL